jgi:putative transposase
MVSPPFLRLGTSQSGATLERRMPWERPLTQSAHCPIMGSKIECIDQNWFLSVEDARLKCEAYRHEYNHERPHSSIGNKIPIEFMKAISTTCPLMA